MIGWLYRLADRLRDRARRRSGPLEAAQGRRGEDLAHRFLRREGFTIVARNYRPPFGGGEIDLIARQGETLVFVEVKTRATAEYGEPDQAVDFEKQEHLERAARDYARRAGVAWDHTRFDILNVILGHPPEIRRIPDAFRMKSKLY